MTTKLPKFQGQNPIDYEMDILGGTFGRSINKAIQRKYGMFPGIQKVGYNSQTRRVEGSTLSYAIAVNEFIRPDGLRTMTFGDVKT